MSCVDSETEISTWRCSVENENTTPVAAESAAVEMSDVAATEPTVQMEDNTTVTEVDMSAAVAEAVEAVAPKARSRRQSNTINLKTLLAQASTALGNDEIAAQFIQFIQAPDSVQGPTAELLKKAAAQITAPQRTTTTSGTNGVGRAYRPAHDVTAPVLEGVKLCQLYQVEVFGPFLVGRNYALKKGWVVRDTRANTDEVFLTAGNKNARAEARGAAEAAVKRLAKAKREELAEVARGRTTVDPQAKGMVIGR
jgi:hypothetical protein